jgi:hypothetical protein
VIQLQSGGNNTIFDHFGKIGSELKSNQTKTQFYFTGLPCGQKGLVTTHKLGLLDNQPAPDSTYQQGKPRHKYSG